MRKAKREGLVQKQVQVTRGGKTFRQTVWVKPGEKEKPQKMRSRAYKPIEGTQNYSRSHINKVLGKWEDTSWRKVVQINRPTIDGPEYRKTKAINALENMVFLDMLRRPEAENLEEMGFTRPDPNLKEYSPGQYYDDLIDLARGLMTRGVPGAWSNKDWEPTS